MPWRAGRKALRDWGSVQGSGEEVVEEAAEGTWAEAGGRIESSWGRSALLVFPAPAFAPSATEIDRRLEKKLKITQKESRKSKSPPKVPIVIQDDSLPTGPPPQIRILKRPTSNGVVSSPNSTSRPALPVKSLAQREAEYAEARKRILGSASPEEEQEKPILDRPTRISQPEDSRQPSNVIRQPLGPDGSQGFKQRR
ncbi:SUZ RNA-binding domain-containing [Dipodomys merriami]|uniref:SUZ RNA-binding domain-containing n=1 Tax=Dipodomys merriami TaxID=94247 RepID=UPI003855C648